MKLAFNLNSISHWPSLASAIESAVRPWLADGKRLIVRVDPEKRSDPANRLLHASIADIAEQLTWAGKKQDVETWKRLLVAAWCRTRGHSIEVLPALDGHGVDIVPARTSKLSRAECSELQEYVYAWGTDQGVKFKEQA